MADQNKPKPAAPNPQLADCCKWCGKRLEWPAAAGIILGDGTAECMACADAEEWRSAATAGGGG